MVPVPCKVAVFEMGHKPLDSAMLYNLYLYFEGVPFSCLSNSQPHGFAPERLKAR